MTESTVSIIIPVYNTPVEKFRQCMDSVTSQSFPDIEVIIVDDGSTGVIVAETDAAAAKDERIRVLHRKNGGVSSARNAGIEAAGGKYVMFVDSDDCLHSMWLAYAVNLADKTDSDIVYGRIIDCPDFPDEKKRCLPLTHGKTLITEDEIHRIHTSLLINTTDLLPDLPFLSHGPGGKLIRRSTIGSLRFSDGLKLSEDQVFNHAILKKSKKCAVTDAAAYFYIENTQSVSHSYHPDAVNMMERAMTEIREALPERPERFWELIHAYYFRVIDDMMMAASFEYFSDGKNKKSLREKSAGVKRVLSLPLMREALDASDGIAGSPIRRKLKVRLLRGGHSFIYAVGKSAADLCQKHLSR